MEFDGPRYQAIMNNFKELIALGRYKPDERLPTVREVASSWSVSHATATKVMREMRRQGYAYVQGNATYVRDRGQAEVTLRLTATGKRPRGVTGPPTHPRVGSEVTEFGLVTPPDYVADVLGVERGAQVFRVEMVDRQEIKDIAKVICLSVHWHPAEFADLDPPTWLTGAQSSMVRPITSGPLMEVAAGRQPTRGLDSSHARTADERESRLMGIPEGETILARIVTYEDDEGVTEYGEFCYPMGVVISTEWNYMNDTDEE